MTIRPRHCTYCPAADPEVCIRMINKSQDDPAGIPVFAHRKCAERNRDQIHYSIVNEGSEAR
ncbi:hypothetical protein [Streptomyces sp. NPDC057250]|uniref:hypothetical protein n=1 Tax=Streptomyces sp. NPDC057250 TaxID=3346068 RepID=UPI003637B157